MIKIVNNKIHVKQTLQVTGDDDGGHTRMPRGLKRLKRVKRAGQKCLKWGLSNWALVMRRPWASKGYTVTSREGIGVILYTYTHSAHTNIQIHNNHTYT